MATEEKDKKAGDAERRLVRDPSSGKTFYLSDDGTVTEVDPQMEQMCKVLASSIVDEMEKRREGKGKKAPAERGSSGGQAGNSLRDRLFKKKE